MPIDMTTSEIAPIFKDPELQKKFDRDGYVKVRLLTPAKAKELYDYYMDHQRDHDVIDGLYLSTTHTNNADLISKVDAHLKSALLGELGHVLQNYEPMMCTYITKQSGPGSDTKLHQDPTFVDESKYISANIWIALHDIDHDNGNLFFVNGTQRYIRSLRVTPDCPTAYDQVKDLLPESLTEVPVKAGEAIIINHATIHGATPNLTKDLRIAAVLAIRSAGSDWIYHYLEPGAPFDQIEKYSVDLDTFIHMKKDGRPDRGKLLGHVSWDFPQISRADFLKNVKEESSDAQPASWLHRFSALKEKLFS